ncbi:MAG TPA: hypothetical protein VMU57_18160 [Edaphobacter sp.]|uniref:hypothetical protein n=1 Tax=Edaphobacter sp. TaxID=1934404 RepID=UPI002C690A14|nr:hypothetical protein [Edaphobacter sp.]HUZ96832.1 hypothetical protein [Edaphobacter sp.]
MVGSDNGTAIRIINWSTSSAEPCEWMLGGKTFDVFAGDSFIVDGDVEHQAAALEASEVLDVFTPVREDYRELVK